MNEIESHTSAIFRHVIENNDHSEYIFSHFGHFSEVHRVAFRGIYAQLDVREGDIVHMGSSYTDTYDVAMRFASCNNSKKGSPAIISKFNVQGVSIVNLINKLIYAIDLYIADCLSDTGRLIANSTKRRLEGVLSIATIEREIIVDSRESKVCSVRNENGKTLIGLVDM